MIDLQQLTDRVRAAGDDEAKNEAVIKWLMDDQGVDPITAREAVVVEAIAQSGQNPADVLH